ncbi:T9SS type A sorting domain-containing protein [Chryseobacterium taeanense]|uniref:T9SS type A sorting domain-containing protein n=1 Tax=Chryseobacterium taeanense TaxID=311334 RepID=UPI0035B22D40
MTKFLLSCLFFLSVMLNAQITLGSGSTDVGVAPISTYFGYSYTQQIFTKQEINANAAGNITGLKFYIDPSMSIANSSQWVVYLGQTTKTDFTSDSDWIPLSQLTQVFSGTVTNTNGVIEVTFATPYPYNNVDNLVVAAEENSPSYDDNNFAEAMYVYSGAANSTITYRDDSTDPDPASPPDGVRRDYKSVTTFEGLTMSATAACPLVTYPLNNSSFVPLSPDITWNNSAGATSYKVSIGTTSGGTDVANQVSVTTNSFTPAAPFAPNTVLYLNVIAVNSAGESAGCSEVMFTTAPPPPVNDECATAITLTVNPDMNCGTVTAGYTVGATDSGTIPDPCYGDPDDDVWFKFVATATTHKISLLNIQSVGSTTGDIDTYFQVFSGGCGALSSIYCSDPESGTVSGLTPGETYLVRVYSYYGTGSNQSFDVCVGTFPPPPANDDCSGAIAATSFPYTYVQNDGAGATNNAGMIDVCSSAPMNDGTWFTFVGDGDTFNITVTMPAGSDFDPRIGVYSGTCSALSCEDSVDNGGMGGAETISIPTVSGNTYYVNVGYYSGYDDQPEGAFTIDINKGTLGTSDVKSEKKNIKVYPNPFSDVVNISDAANVKSVSVSDVSGRLIRVIDNPGSSIHLGELRQGMYLLTLIMKDGSKQTIKTIKK